MLHALNCQRTESSAATATAASLSLSTSAAAADCACGRLRDDAGVAVALSDSSTHTPIAAHSHAQLRFGCLRLWPLLLLALLLTLSAAQAAPQSSCILCDKEDLRAKEPANSETYEEFLFDHQVSRQDAIQALRSFNETYSRAQNSCNSVKCTDKVLRYCLGAQFINDHCWCELRHSEEGLPYVPHTCFVGEKVYKPSVGSCFFFEEVKECCCAAALAKKWRHISGATRSSTEPKMLCAMLAALSLLHWLRSWSWTRWTRSAGHC